MSWAMRKNAFAIGLATMRAAPRVRFIAGRSAPMAATSRARARSCSIAELAGAPPAGSDPASSGGRVARRSWTLSWMRRISASTSISGFFTSSMLSFVGDRRHPGAEVRLSIGFSRFCPLGGADVAVFALDQIEQSEDTLLENPSPESSCALPCSPLDGLAQTAVADETQSMQAQLIEGAEPEPARTMLDDLALAAAVDDDRGAAVLHRLDGGHAEMLDQLRVGLAKATGMPEDRRAGVPAEQLVERNVDADLDPIAIASRRRPDGAQVRVSLQTAAGEDQSPAREVVRKCFPQCAKGVHQLDLFLAAGGLESSDREDDAFLRDGGARRVDRWVEEQRRQEAPSFPDPFARISGVRHHDRVLVHGEVRASEEVGEVADEDGDRRARPHLLQHVGVDEHVVVSAGAGDGVEWIFHSVVDAAGIDPLPACEERDLDEAELAAGEVETVPGRHAAQVHVLVHQVGDVESVLQRGGHRRDVLLASPDDVEGMVVDADGHLATAPRDLPPPAQRVIHVASGRAAPRERIAARRTCGSARSAPPSRIPSRRAAAG